MEVEDRRHRSSLSGEAIEFCLKLGDPLELRLQFPAYLIEARVMLVENRTISKKNLAARVENVDDVVELGSCHHSAP